MEKEKGFLQGLATALNAGGSALVTAYDASATMVTKSAHYVKETAPKLPDSAVNIFKSGTAAILPGEKGKLKSRIRDLEGKIKKSHYDIGAESSKFTSPGIALDTLVVKGLISNVMKFEGEIDVAKTRLIELEKINKVEEEQKKAIKVPAIIKQKALDEHTVKSRASIADALEQGVFEPAARDTFESDANRLLSDEQATKVLSVVEPGEVVNTVVASEEPEQINMLVPDMDRVSALEVQAEQAAPEEPIQIKKMAPEKVSVPHSANPVVQGVKKMFSNQPTPIERKAPVKETVVVRPEQAVAVAPERDLAILNTEKPELSGVAEIENLKNWWKSKPKAAGKAITEQIVSEECKKPDRVGMMVAEIDPALFAKRPASHEVEEIEKLKKWLQNRPKSEDKANADLAAPGEPDQIEMMAPDRDRALFGEKLSTRGADEIKNLKDFWKNRSKSAEKAEMKKAESEKPEQTELLVSGSIPVPGSGMPATQNDAEPGKNQSTSVEKPKRKKSHQLKNQEKQMLPHAKGNANNAEETAVKNEGKGQASFLEKDLSGDGEE